MNSAGYVPLPFHPLILDTLQLDCSNSNWELLWILFILLSFLFLYVDSKFPVLWIWVCLVGRLLACLIPIRLSILVMWFTGSQYLKISNKNVFLLYRCVGAWKNGSWHQEWVFRYAICVHFGPVWNQCLCLPKGTCIILQGICKQALSGDVDRWWGFRERCTIVYGCKSLFLL